MKKNNISQIMIAGLALLVLLYCGDRTIGAPSKPGLFSQPYKNENAALRIAIFAGGCFWCMEPPFEKLDGVKDAISGYSGGKEKYPTYDDVSYGRTTHAESVLVLYDSTKVTYEKLLDVFWHNINPEQTDGQFYDIGAQYKTYIFYANEAEKAAALKSKANLLKTGKFSSIATDVLPRTDFWRAEDYHQDYYKKNPDHYHRYRAGSGRDDYLKSKWGAAK